MVYVRTCAYNAEKTLKRAIDSILNQTHEELIYYILDNGSTDGTREIIRYYAEQDKRIVPFYSDRNFDLTENDEFWNLFYALSEGDYLCLLDADDAYDITFLEEALRMLTDNELDIVMCGTIFMNADTWTPCGERVLEKDIVIKDGTSFEESFPMIYWNLRAMWGKLYTAKAARFPYTSAIGLPEWYPTAYGGDTVNVFGSIELADGIGVLAKPLHYYAVSQKSTSYCWLEGREKSDPLLFKKAEELLMKKCGKMSPNNCQMLYAVYFHAVNDTFHVLFQSDLPAEKRLNITSEIFFHSITQKMFTTRFNVPNNERINFFEYVVIKLLTLWKELGKDSYTMLADIFNNINPDFKQLITQESFTWFMDNRPVIMRNVVLREYEYGVNNLIVYLHKEGVHPYENFPYILGQQLAAVRNEEEKYVLFSKLLIRNYIENRQLERADVELREWERILPKDRDIRNLRKLYNQRGR